MRVIDKLHEYITEHSSEERADGYVAASSIGFGQTSRTDERHCELRSGAAIQGGLHHPAVVALVCPEL